MINMVVMGLTDQCQMVTALQTEVTEAATIGKTLMEATMNLMPFLAFQISYSETPKMFSKNFLVDGTRLKTFLIVSDLNFREIVVLSVLPAFVSRIFLKL